MKRAWWLKFWIIAAFSTFSILSVIPTLAGKGNLPKWYTDVFDKELKQGLDLQGGIHLVLDVEVDKALEDKRGRMVEEFKNRFKELKVGVTDGYLEEEDPWMTFILEAGAKDKFLDEIKKDYRVSVVYSGDKKISLALNEDYEKQTKELSVEQAIKTLRNRIDQYGVSEPVISKRGETAIQIQLPGEENPERAKDLLGRTAQLSFRMVKDGDTFFKDLTLPSDGSITLGNERVSSKGGGAVTSYYLQSKDRKTLVNFFKGKKPPKGYEVLFGKRVEKMVEQYQTFLAQKIAPLTGEYLTDATVQINQDLNQPYVSLTFDSAGAEIFSDLTEKNVGRRMAIVLDKMVDSAPVINEKIPFGRAQINLGGFKSYSELLSEANDLAIVLRAGALPAPVRIEEERTVGPTLGADSIKKGKLSIQIGFVLVFIFMILYYRGSGIIADIALILNIFFILTLLSSFKATLTLPGIAGIVLTMGMAVDANVIIFERIREELAAGKSPRAAIDLGYAKAITAIMDANITTLIAGIVLYQYGSGPIKGFAVTLMIGIITSVFSAVTVTRTIYEFFLDRGRVKKLSI